MYEGPALPDDEVLSVYVVLNGSLGMSGGKAASQSFHCGWLVGAAMEDLLHFSPQAVQNMEAWRTQGRRVVVRVAETEGIFTRVVAETECAVQRDEGLTEVEHGARTALVTVPYRRGREPQILRHKRVQLYGQPKAVL